MSISSGDEEISEMIKAENKEIIRDQQKEIEAFKDKLAYPTNK